MSVRKFVDRNLLIYTDDRANPEKHAFALDLVSAPWWGSFVASIYVPGRGRPGRAIKPGANRAPRAGHLPLSRRPDGN
ncbi:MAG: hypothetical protein KF778_11370 [Rhodocyclaceae bacterium]|nr:hypothetical protein [Rhodocyclaceae bacterium]MBX3668994.1 hypothetical protein [Rhodocyclaceae bacterium]